MGTEFQARFKLPPRLPTRLPPRLPPRLPGALLGHLRLCAGCWQDPRAADRNVRLGPLEIANVQIRRAWDPRDVAAAGVEMSCHRVFASGAASSRELPYTQGPRLEEATFCDLLRRACPQLCVQ